MPSDVCSGDAHGLDIVKRLIHSSSFGDPSPNHLDAKNTPELSSPGTTGMAASASVEAASNPKRIKQTMRISVMFACEIAPALLRSSYVPGEKVGLLAERCINIIKKVPIARISINKESACDEIQDKP